MDNHSLEVRFFSAIQALAMASQSPRAITKSIQELPESVGAADAIHQAVMDGLPMDRLRTIVKSSQGDSRRGRAISGRILDWMEEGRPAPEGERPIAKAASDVPGVGTLPDGFLKWQLGTDAYSTATRQGLMEEPRYDTESSQATDIPHKGNAFKLPGKEIAMPGTDEPKKKKVNPKTDLVD
jgi:hypothetical protein